MRAILSCALAVVVCCTASADDKIDAKKIVGKWEPKEAKKDETLSMVFEFTKDGKVTVTIKTEKELKREGTYKVDGNKLTVTMTVNGKEQVRTRTITKLTDMELVSSDEKGKEATLVRIKDK
jgi:uncharacterized protein (TIGR03066 family)